MSMIPEKTIERLSRYRYLLNECRAEGKQNIFSYELAVMMHTTPAQVRQDLMSTGYCGSPRKGYVIQELICWISRVLDAESGTKIVLVGAGNLGKAILSYYKGNRPKLSIVAAFDTDPGKVNRVISGVRCYHINQAEEIIKNLKASVGIISCPAEFANEAAWNLIRAGIKGLLNFTSVSLEVPPNVFVQEINITTYLEKVAYFAKHEDS